MSESEGPLTLAKWISIVESVRARIDGLPDKDRLELCSSMMKCVDAVRNSAIGWQTWLAAPTTMREFTEAELVNWFKQVRGITTRFLDLDLDASRLLFSKLEASKEKEKEQGKGKNGHGVV